MRVRFGAYVFDSEGRELSRDGVPISLSPKAFALLELLIEAAPSALSKEAIYERLWPDTFVEAGNLHNLVSEIRSAFTGEDRSMIRTVHRFGYAFIAAAVPEKAIRYAIALGDEQIPLRNGVNVIGRDADNAIVINAPDVSRHHARLIVAGSQVTLEDHGSKNGTFLSTTRVTAPVLLHDGDEIVIGTTRMQLRAMNILESTVTRS